tara:strand:+ start:109 stop:282 length:174 start_codon:yes stop_codon:yes gene_type:complete
MKTINFLHKENDTRYVHPSGLQVYGVKSRLQISAKKGISKYDYQKQIFKNGMWVNNK